MCDVISIRVRTLQDNYIGVPIHFYVLDNILRTKRVPIPRVWRWIKISNISSLDLTAEYSSTNGVCAHCTGTPCTFCTCVNVPVLYPYCTRVVIYVCVMSIRRFLQFEKSNNNPRTCRHELFRLTRDEC